MNKEPYLVSVIKKHGTKFFDTFNEILNKQLRYVDIKLKKVPEKLNCTEKFTCKQCGDKCCDMKQSKIACEVFPSDLRKWVDSDLGLILVSIGVSMYGDRDNRDVMLFIDRKQDYEAKKRFRLPEYIDNIVKVNPSLAMITEIEKQQCVFFNNLSSTCSIYQFRPLSCRCFPYGISTDFVVQTTKDLCGNECFTPGKPDNWSEIEKVLKLTWSNIHGLKMFIKAKIGGNAGYDANRKRSKGNVDREIMKREQIIGITAKMYQNFITTLYFLFPEFTNIEEMTKEMRK